MVGVRGDQPPPSQSGAAGDPPILPRHQEPSCWGEKSVANWPQMMDGRGDASTAPVPAAGPGMGMGYRTPSTHHRALGAARGERPVGAHRAAALIPGDLAHVHPPRPATLWWCHAD